MRGMIMNVYNPREASAAGQMPCGDPERTSIPQPCAGSAYRNEVQQLRQTIMAAVDFAQRPLGVDDA